MRGAVFPLSWKQIFQRSEEALQEFHRSSSGYPLWHSALQNINSVELAVFLNFPLSPTNFHRQGLTFWLIAGSKHVGRNTRLMSFRCTCPGIKSVSNGLNSCLRCVRRRLYFDLRKSSWRWWLSSAFIQAEGNSRAPHFIQIISKFSAGETLLKKPKITLKRFPAITREYLTRRWGWVFEIWLLTGCIDCVMTLPFYGHPRRIS